MKKIRRGSGAALIALCALSANQALASEVVNIPATASMANNDFLNNECYVTHGEGIHSIHPGTMCELDFPLTIPTGHTIKQIALLYGTNSNYPNPYIFTMLETRQTAVPFALDSHFFWTSTTPAADPPTVTKVLLMAQLGKVYPESFIVQADVMYHVWVHLAGGAYTQGLQVTYD